MKTRYAVKWLETSKKLGDVKETWTGTFDYRKFSKTHHVLEVWVVELSKAGTGHRFDFKYRVY